MIARLMTTLELDPDEAVGLQVTDPPAGCWTAERRGRLGTAVPRLRDLTGRHARTRLPPVRIETRTMKTSQLICSTASGPPTPGDLLADIVPVIDTVFVAGPPVLVMWAGTVLLALMLAGPFALLVTFVVVLVAAAALVALAGAILATPYLLIRRFRAHRVRHATSGTARQALAVASQRAIA